MKHSQDLGLLILRLTLGAVFMAHGYMKLHGIDATTGFMTMLGVPLPGFFAWVVGLVEFFGGLALVLGVYAKTAAMLLVVNMIVALLIVHLGKPWAGAELALLALGGSAAISVLGAGKWRLWQNAECACGSCGMCGNEKHSH